MNTETAQQWIAKALLVNQCSAFREVLSVATGTVKKLKQNSEVIEHCSRRIGQIELELERLQSLPQQQLHQPREK